MKCKHCGKPLYKRADGSYEHDKRAPREDEHKHEPADETPPPAPKPPKDEAPPPAPPPPAPPKDETPPPPKPEEEPDRSHVLHRRLFGKKEEA